MPSPSAKLQLAAGAGDLVAVRQLLHAGADPNWADDDCRTALYLAVLCGHLLCVRALLADPRTLVNRASRFGQTPLAVAASGGRLDCLRVLLADERVLPEQRDQWGRTALWLSANDGHLACVEALVADGRIHIDLADEEAWTALFAAARKGYAGVVEALLRSGADSSLPPSLGHDKGKLPVDVAKQRGHCECTELLEHAFTPWTPGPGGRLQHMPKWVKRRAMSAAMALRRKGIPQEIIDVILAMCVAGTRRS